jgi:hypothetical protein
MVELDTLIDPSLRYTFQGAAINDLGQIVADGMDAAGQPIAVLLTPVPEPSMAALLVAAATSFLAWQCRHRRSPPTLTEN